jgi:hypothetical protein
LQKVHLFHPSLSFLAEAQPRIENRRGQKALFGEVHIKVSYLNLNGQFFKPSDEDEPLWAFPHPLQPPLMARHCRKVVPKSVVCFSFLVEEVGSK